MNDYRIDYFPADGGHEKRYYMTLEAAMADADYIRQHITDRRVFVLERIADTKYYDIIEMF